VSSFIVSFSASNETVFVLLSFITSAALLRDGTHIFEKLIEGILSIEEAVETADVGAACLSVTAALATAALVTTSGGSGEPEGGVNELEGESDG